ncbi:hypothetical protein MC885_002288, partial [Smutsia gigantea]
MKATFNGKPRTDLAAFENGGGECYVPQRIIVLGVDENEALTEKKEITMSKCLYTKDNKAYPAPECSLTVQLAPIAHVLMATENVGMKHTEDPSSMNDVHLVRQPHYKGMSKRNGFMMNQRTSLAQECREFKKVQAPNPQNKMSYHRNNKNRNAGNASYIHAHRDVVRPVKSNARPHSRPTNRSYNKANVNKEPKLNLCP